jgi:hypothetical protein
MMNVKPVSLLSAHEKMPFEVTPFNLHLTRLPGKDSVGTGGSRAVETAEKK